MEKIFFLVSQMNNFRILRYYEYLQLIKAKNGPANQYRLIDNYSDLDFLNTILKPEELEKKNCNRLKDKKHLNLMNIPVHTGSNLLICFIISN